jgi:translation initiation factor 2 subunit 1
VTLLEYNNIEGMILFSELSRRRIRSISKLIRVGKTEVVMVLRVDEEKGYIDLSKRRVSPEDIGKCEDRYNKAKTVHGILRHVASEHDLVLEELYTSIGWPLYRKYGHAYDAFKQAAVSDPDAIFAGLTIADEVKTTLLENIRRRLSPQAVKVRADIELTCFTEEGIEAIRAALMAGQELTSEEVPIKIKLIAPPLYVMLATCMDKEKGLAALRAAIEAVKKVILERGGSIAVPTPPQVTSQRDESELASMMERVALENREVDGDTPEE